MTRQEIQALIDAKIKGQGTAVDAGSVLPAILTGILDLIEQGGGGGTADAVQYIPQELTGAQQMQARKNQGLYYSEGGGDVTINWDGDTTGLETVGGLYKISEDAPSASEVKSVSMIQNGVGQTYEVGVAPAQIVELDGGYAIGSLACLVITADEVSVQGTTYTKGVWFVYGNENNRTSQLVYGQIETIHQIPEKYIPSMGAPAVKMTVPSMGDREFTNIGLIVLNQYITSRQVEISVDGGTIEFVEVIDFTDPTSPVSDVSVSDNIVTISRGGIFVISVALTDDKVCVGILFCDNYV